MINVQEPGPKKGGSIKEMLIGNYLGPIAGFFEMEGVTAIFVNSYDNILIRRKGEIEPTSAVFENEDKLDALVEQIGKNLGQKIDRYANPILDARLPDGSRINAVMFPTSPRGTNLTIRLFPKVRFSTENLFALGVFDAAMYEYLKCAVRYSVNGLISGSTGSGKTTVLNAFANLIPPADRTLVIEDTQELNVSIPNILYMEAPKRKVKDGDTITMERLLVNTLRQEGKRLLVGETREPGTATALMLAVNTGSEFVWSSIHANSETDATRRLINLLLANDSRMPYEAVRYEVMHNMHVLVHCERTPLDGQRIVGISEIVEGEVVKIFQWSYKERRHLQINDSVLMPKFAEKYGP